MTDRDDTRPWKLNRRFEFIEWRLFWEGRVNRSHIEKKFRISTQQASADLNGYRDVAPNNITYNPNSKTYEPSIGFVPLVSDLSADRLLLQLRAILSEAIKPEDTWFADLPPVAVAPDITRRIEAPCLRAMLWAIKDRREVCITYQSLTNTRARTIAPHSLAFDGHRWHARAWCPERREFRDFLLSRILSFEESGPANFDADDDVEWTTHIALTLKPHPGLNEPQRQAIERDYNMQSGSLTLHVRLALAFYFVKRLNLDLDLDPNRKQIELENLREIEPAQAAAKAEALQRISKRSETSAGQTPNPKPAS